MKQQVQELTRAISEDEAIEKAKRGDVTGFDVLYHLHKRRIFALCLKLTGSVPDAEDLMQEVFLQVFRKLSTFRGNAKLGSWLYRVTFNFALMRSRRRRPNQQSLTPILETLQYPALDLPCAEFGRCQAVELVALGKAIGALPSGRRTVLLLHDIWGYAHVEIAKRLGLAVNSSRSHLYRAHVTLRALLGAKVKTKLDAEPRK